MNLSKTYKNGVVYLVAYISGKDELEFVDTCFSNVDAARRYAEHNVFNYYDHTLYVVASSKNGYETLIKVSVPEPKPVSEIFRANLET